MRQSKNLILALALCAFTTTIISCDSNKTDKTSDTTTVTEEKDPASTPTPAPAPASASSSSEDVVPSSQAKTYQVVLTPDNATIGKDQEALVQITDAKAIALSDPDGKEKGTEFTFNVKLTNKSAIGSGSQVNLSTGDWRLILDNGEKISNQTTARVNVQPESTGTSDRSAIYLIPAGRKAKSLSLFYKDTRAEIGVDIQ